MARTTTTGLDAMRRKMAAIPRKIRAEMETSLAASAEELVAMQKRLAPVDGGQLRDSIRWVRGTVSGVRGMRGALTAENVSRDNMTATVLTTDFKAAFVEFGTVKRTATPFFFPAYRALKRRIKSRISRAVNKAIKAGAR